MSQKINSFPQTERKTGLGYPLATSAHLLEAVELQVDPDDQKKVAFFKRLADLIGDDVPKWPLEVADSVERILYEGQLPIKGRLYDSFGGEPIPDELISLTDEEVKDLRTQSQVLARIAFGDLFGDQLELINQTRAGANSSHQANLVSAVA